MRTIWQALAWKEWHEHKWKLSALTAVFCGVNALILSLVHQDPRQDLFEAVYAMTMCCAIPLAVFLGAGVAAGERSRGTAPFLGAFPLSPKIFAACKLVAGLVTLVAALVLAFVFVYGSYECMRVLGYDVKLPLPRRSVGLPHPFVLSNWFVSRALAASLIAGSVYLWTAAAGVNRQDEVSAAARGMLAMVAWWLTLFAVSRWIDAQWLRTDGWWLVATFQSASPGGIGIASPPGLALPLRSILGVPLPVFAGLLFHLGLAYWFVSRFGCTTAGGVHSPRTARAPVGRVDWLGPPRRSPLAAIAWKQYRESGPLVLVGFAGILAIVAVICISNWRDMDGDTAVKIYAAVTVAMGLLVTLVVGIGVSIFDLSPALNTFWRSRPINPNLWYWTKLITGLLLVFVSLYLPVLATVLLRSGASFWQEMSYDAVLLPAFAVGIFISAVTMTCLVRHPIYAAILSIAALYVGPILVQTIWVAGRRLFGPEFDNVLPLPQHGKVIFAVTMATVSTAMLIFGWLAVRNDWGRKSRY